MNKFKRVIATFLFLLLMSVSVLIPMAQDGKAVAASAKPDDSLGSAVTEARGDVRVSSRIWELLFGKSDNGEAVNVQTNVCKTVILGGDVFGARIKQNSVTVQDPCQVSELKHGDVILKINGTCVYSASEVKDAVKGSDGNPVRIQYKRGRKLLECTLTPILKDGEYRLDIEIRDGAAGIGTITYIDPETGEFGGLGHGICDQDSGEVISISSGTVTGVILGGIQKGESGKPGELTGILTDRKLGEVYANTRVGVFGKLDTPIPQNAKKIELGTKDDVKCGAATIVSTLKNGKKMEYSIEIFDIDKSSDGTKSFKIKVTDPALLAISAGIVRGMSGSPIIQGGKLIGAVTHVMVADPTEGYGIFIENMLSAGKLPMAKAS